MARGLSRWVIPKTTEAQRAKTSEAVKGEKLSVIISFPSWFLPDGDVVRVDGGDDVEQPGADHKLGPVVGGGAEDGARAPVHVAGEEIEQPVAEVAGEAEHLE